MSIGLGIFLLVVGAILTFALNIQADWIDLDLVGYLLMGAGLVVTIIGIVLMMRKRQTVVTERTVDGHGREQVRERSSSSTPDPVER